MIKWKKKRWQYLGRLSVLLLCSLALIGMLEYGSLLTQRYYQMLSEQTQTLSRMLVRQAAENAASDITDNNQDKLQKLVNNLSNEPLILDATIYNIEGVTLAKTDNSMPLTQLTGLSTPLAMASIGRQQIVEPIFANKHVIGFVRITLEHNKLLAHAKDQIHYMTRIIRGLTLASLMIGLLLAFTFGRRKDIWHFPFFLTANAKD